MCPSLREAFIRTWKITEVRERIWDLRMLMDPSASLQWILYGLRKSFVRLTTVIYRHR